MTRIVSLSVIIATLLMLQSEVLAQQATIELRANPTIRTMSPCLGDLATVECKDRTLRESIEAIDMPSLKEGENSLTVTRRQVQTRLLFAGYSTNEFVLKGANSVTASYSEQKTITDADVEQAALRSVAEMLGREVSEFRVLLNSPVMQNIPQNMKDLDDPRIEVRPQRAGLGMVPMQVQIWDGKELKRMVPVTCEVRKKHRVAVARVSLSSDQPVSVQQIAFEERFLDKQVDELTFDQVVGQTVRAGVQAGSVIQVRDMRTSVNGGKVVIKKGNFVTATASTGRLRVSLRDAEALQDGALGDSIRLRNRQTGETIVGEVIGVGRVVIRPYADAPQNAGPFEGGFGR